MCKYCDGSYDVEPLLDTRTEYSSKRDFYPGVTVWIDRDEHTLNVDSVADVYEPNYIEESVKINFCPMCGEKL
jgi:hypothetical protein